MTKFSCIKFLSHWLKNTKEVKIMNEKLRTNMEAHHLRIDFDSVCYSCLWSATLLLILELELKSISLLLEARSCHNLLFSASFSNGRRLSHSKAPPKTVSLRKSRIETSLWHFGLTCLLQQGLRRKCSVCRLVFVIE